MIVVGLAGGMGQGKSTIGRILRQLAKVDYRADLEASHPITEVANAWIQTWPQPLVLDPDDNVVSLANELIETLPPIIEKFTGKKVPDRALFITDDAKNLELNNRLIHYLAGWTALSESERAAQLPLPIAPQNKGLHRALFQWLGGVTVAVVAPTIWSDLLDHRIRELSSRGYKLVTVGGIRYDHDAAMIHANSGVIVRVVRPETTTSTDVTENSLNAVKPDTEIINNGSMDQLDTVVHHLFADLEAGKPAERYTAAE